MILLLFPPFFYLILYWDCKEKFCLGQLWELKVQYYPQKSTKTRNAVVVKKLSKCHNTIYDFHIFTTVYSPRHKFIWNQHIDQLPVGLLAQLVEHCTGISEVHWSNPIQAWIFFRPFFHYFLSSVHYYEDRFHIHTISTIYNCMTVFSQKKNK